MLDKIFTTPAKIFLGKGIDKNFPFLVDLYKKVYVIVAKNGELKVKIPMDMKLIVSAKDCGLGMFLRTKGEFEPLQTKLFLDSLKPGMVVFDIGANVGYYTLLASKLVGTKGKVYAFEPDPNNLELLKKNVSLNNCSNVTIVKKALGEKEETAILSLDKANPGESSLAKTAGEEKVKVEVITLDKFIKQKKIQRADVIKMDIEGAEIMALTGGQDFLQQTRGITLFIECNVKSLRNFGVEPEDLINKLEGYGFKIVKIINEFEKRTDSYIWPCLLANLEKVSYVSLFAQK